MQCCSGPCSTDADRIAGTDRFFSKRAKSYARAFHKSGLEKIQRLLLDGMRGAAGPDADLVRDAEVLDVGCGVGGLHLALLESGAATARGVDISAGMLEHAQRFAEERGLRERITYHQGDIAALGEQVPAVDLTVMDKVICCYEDAPGLVAAIAGRTRRALGLTYPRDNLFVRIGFATHKFLARLFRWRFHPCSHNWHEVRRMICDHGFTETSRNRTFFWEAAVFHRVAS